MPLWYVLSLWLSDRCPMLQKTCLLWSSVFVSRKIAWLHISNHPCSRPKCTWSPNWVRRSAIFFVSLHRFRPRLAGATGYQQELYIYIYIYIIYRTGIPLGRSLRPWLASRCHFQPPTTHHQVHTVIASKTFGLDTGVANKTTTNVLIVLPVLNGTISQQINRQCPC